MRYLKTTLTVIGAVTVLVLAGNTVALAATGHALLLGKSNSADANTSITRTTSGSVLKLQSKSSLNSPLTVNGTGKVTNLNADRVDGLSASAFGRAPIATGYVNAGTNGTAPTLVHHKGPATSVSWDAGNSWYRITLTGVNYYYADYMTVISSSCDNGLSTSVASVSGKLLVLFGTDAPTCPAGFAYAVYKLT